MKKLFFLPLAAFVFAACSETTAPETNADLSPSYAKGGKGGGGGGGGGGGPTNVLFHDTYTFDSDIGAANSGWGTQLDPEVGIGSVSDAVIATAPTGQKFLGRFENTFTQATLGVINGSAKYELAFDFYTIGSWDGKGKQAQQGSFDANMVQVSYQCAGPASQVVMFSTTFSTQLTVQQDYPKTAFSGGGAKAATGSIAIDALGYRNRSDLSNTPPFRSFGDVTYRLTFAGANPCGAGQPVTFVIGTKDPTQQSMWDESWGIDNVSIKTGT